MELGLLVLELGLLALEFGFLQLERCPGALQLGGLRLGFLSLLLCCSSLDVALTGGLRQLLLQRLPTHLQIRHLRVGVDTPEHQASVVLPKPAYLGVQPGNLGAFLARDVPQPLQEERRG